MENKSTIWVIVILVILVILGLIFFASSPTEPEVSNIDLTGNTESTLPSATSTSSTSTGATASTSTSVGVGATVGTVKSFTVTASPFKFSSAEIKVKKGDTVKITLVNSSGQHDLVIDEFNASTKVLQSGQSDTIQFVASKTGTFEYYCSVANHRQMGMVGKLIVE